MTSPVRSHDGLLEISFRARVRRHTEESCELKLKEGGRSFNFKLFFQDNKSVYVGTRHT